MWDQIKQAGKKGLEVVGNAPVSGVLKVGIMAGVAIFTAWIMIKRTQTMYREAHQPSFVSPVDQILQSDYLNDPTTFYGMDPEAQRICKKLNPRGRKWTKKKKKKADDVPVVSIFDDPQDIIAPPPPSKAAPRYDEVEVPRYYKDAEEVMKVEHQLRKVKQAKKQAKKQPTIKEPQLDYSGIGPKQVARARRNLSRHPDVLERIRRGAAEWQTIGLMDIATNQRRVDQCARALGLPVDDTDDRVSDAQRDHFPDLF